LSSSTIGGADPRRAGGKQGDDDGTLSAPFDEIVIHAGIRDAA
jgi:hypothetical protein